MKQPEDLTLEDYFQLCQKSGTKYRADDFLEARGHIKALLRVAHQLREAKLSWPQISKWFEEHGVKGLVPETLARCWNKHCHHWAPTSPIGPLIPTERPLPAIKEDTPFHFAYGQGRIFFANAHEIYSFPEGSAIHYKTK